MTRSCRTCRYLDVPLDKAGRRVARIGHIYQCTFPTPTLPPMPESWTKGNSAQAQRDFEHLYKLNKAYMGATDGASCAVWLALEKKS